MNYSCFIGLTLTTLNQNINNGDDNMKVENTEEFISEEIKMLNSGNFRFISVNKKDQRIMSITKTYDDFVKVLDLGFRKIYQCHEDTLLEFMRQLGGLPTVLYADDDILALIAKHAIELDVK